LNPHPILHSCGATAHDIAYLSYVYVLMFVFIYLFSFIHAYIDLDLDINIYIIYPDLDLYVHM